MTQHVMGLLLWFGAIGVPAIGVFAIFISTLGPEKPPPIDRETMMRVPANPDSPTFDDTITIGLWRWLTSSAADRKEWARRRNVAAQVARQGQMQRAQAKAQEMDEAIGRGFDQAQQHLHTAAEAAQQARRVRRAARRF